MKITVTTHISLGQLLKRLMEKNKVDTYALDREGDRVSVNPDVFEKVADEFISVAKAGTMTDEG